jgi:hypothetical protein
MRRSPRKSSSSTSTCVKMINPGAQFEISIDGLPRTYRDRKEIALLAAQVLKSRNPNSAVKVKDLKTGEEIVIAFNKSTQK